MNKALKNLLYFTLLFSTISLSAQSSKVDNLTKIIATRFSKMWINAPQEKVYLHTDKPYYNAGEEIWFKGYLVNASTLIPNTKSQFIYVELIDNSDTVVTRVKIKKDSLGFAGNIKLSAEIQSGTYCLRAYTFWMQNQPNDYFFSKNIFIGNSIDDRINCEATFGTPDGSKIPLNLSFTNAFNNAITDKDLTITQSWVSTNKRKISTKLSATGKVSLQLFIDTAYKAKKYLDLQIKEPGIKFNNKIYIPDFDKDFDFQLFPESGTFLNDDMQHLGFKAIAKNGLSVNVEGKVYNNKNEELSEFTSTNKGMGRIVIKTNPGESYYTIVKSIDGIQKKIDFPTTQAEGISLHLSYNRTKIVYQVINKTNIPSESLSLLIHARGVVYVVFPLYKIDGQITEAMLPAGITSFSIIDSTGNVYCERSYFNRNFQLPSFELRTDKTIYGRRDAVNVDVKVQNTEGKALAGNFSVSVTDSKNVIQDTLSNNILSYLLLSSDIKGYIEDPGRYFIDNSSVTREITDLLMLTQAWRRYNTADLAKGIIKVPDYYLEAGQAVTGKVLNILGKPSKDRDVIMLSGYKNSIGTAKTDSLGQFIIDGFEFPDSTTIVLKAKSKTKLVDVDLIWDKDVFPTSNVFIPYRMQESKVSNDYFQLSKEKYYTEGGMLMINLDDFTVNASAKVLDPQDTYYSQLADNVLNSEKLENYSGMSIIDIIGTMPGVQANGQSISIRGSNGNPLFVVDGIETEEIDDILYLNSFDIEAIYLFKGVSASTFGSRGGNGVIAITLKKGIVRQYMTPSSLAHVKPLGFQKPTQFYVPKYDLDSILKQPKADYRTTIYWNPKLATDSAGNMNFKFFTADKANNYDIIIEGISNSGEICRYKAILRRED